VSRPGVNLLPPFEESDAPVLQVVLSSGGEAEWRAGTRGLSPRDLAMQVALPEIDGRILSRAIAFKGIGRRDPLTECDIVAPVANVDRVEFVADLARGWIRLRATDPAKRRLAIVLANYPNRNGRLGNGVGLDTPAGTIEVLRALETAGYNVGDAPKDGGALIAMLLSGPTNAKNRMPSTPGLGLPISAYGKFLAQLPDEAVSG
jgi:cobaltochelatase CobN